MLSYTIFGESHGPAIGVTLTGVPPGLAVDEGFIAEYRPAGGGCASNSLRGV